MYSTKHILLTGGTIAALAVGGITLSTYAVAAAPTGAMAAEMKMPDTPMDHGAEATRYEQEASALEAKAEHHAKMAVHYRQLVGGGSKSESGYRSLATHCDLLADRYRKAAMEAREMAKAHRAMVK